MDGVRVRCDYFLGVCKLTALLAAVLVRAIQRLDVKEHRTQTLTQVIEAFDSHCEVQVAFLSFTDKVT